jgi:trimethylamine--corrinoid protein Co-methyltransferase
MGFSGNYLMETHTFKRCRYEFHIPDLANRATHTEWMAMEDREITVRAGKLLEKRLADYEKPPMELDAEKQLRDYVARRKVEESASDTR